MYTKTKYCCSVCNSEYEYEARALQCDELGLPAETSNIKVGDKISFSRDVAHQVTGEIKTYVTNEGTVLAREVKYNNMKNAHHDLFIIETEDENGKYEGLAALINVNGKMEMFMAATPRYKPGFASTITTPKTNGE